jgi:hypothetical protein
MIVSPLRQAWINDLNLLCAERGQVPNLVFTFDDGPARTGGRSITIPERYLKVPPLIRRFILGHELGHIRRRHKWSSLALSALASIVAVAYAPVHGIAAFVIGLGLLVLPWELDADRYAANLIGPESSLLACTWLGHHNPGFIRRCRIAQLQKIVQRAQPSAVHE